VVISPIRICDCRAVLLEYIPASLNEEFSQCNVYNYTRRYRCSAGDQSAHTCTPSNVSAASNLLLSNFLRLNAALCSIVRRCLMYALRTARPSIYTCVHRPRLKSSSHFTHSARAIVAGKHWRIQGGNPTMAPSVFFSVICPLPIRQRILHGLLGIGQFI